MSPATRLLTAVFMVVWPWASSLAQNITDQSTLRFAHSFERERVRMLLESRNGAATRFLNAAREMVALQEGGGRQRTLLLAEIQYLADSVANLDLDIGEASTAAGQAQDNLIRVLVVQVAREENGDRRIALEAELRQLRALDNSVDLTHPFQSAANTLNALSQIVAEERARLSTLRRLQDELRLFLGNLRLFDETGMPPSVRSDAGSGTDPGVGCTLGISALPATVSPGDLPLEHFHSGAVSDDRLEGATPISLESLRRLEEQLTNLRGDAEEITRLRDSRESGFVTRDLTIEASLLTFRDDAGGLTGLRLEAGSSLLLPFALGRGLQLTLEPRMGGRSVQLDPGSSTEVTGEVWESFLGTAGGGRLRWQVSSWQKGRYLSDPLPLPAYLEPGRKEGGLTSRAALSVRPGWDMELGGGGSVVRYSPDEWQVLDREGLNAHGALTRYGTSGFGRLSFMVSRSRFSMVSDVRRMDTRLGAVADWALDGRVVLRLSVGAAWNDSRLSAYDYRSARAAVVFSAPLRSSSIQLYGTLTHRNYRNPGPEDARVAPSDQDTGSIVVVQFTRPVIGGQSFAIRAEWARSETGFRNDFYQRFGLSAQLSFRGRGDI